MNGSRVNPRLAILKPLSAAISIGSGGPFGAEGPIIMTGGAFGSMIAQFFHFTSMERQNVAGRGSGRGHVGDVCGAAFLGVDRRRTAVVRMEAAKRHSRGLASATACAVRRYMLGLGPLFPVSAHPVFIGPAGLGGCVVAGTCRRSAIGAAHPRGIRRRGSVQEAADSLDVVAGDRRRVCGIGRTDLSAGAGRWIRHHRRLCSRGMSPLTIFAGVLLVKSAIWMISLGSGTSGGVLAPLLMMGAALGGIESIVSCPTSARVSGRWSAWARFSAARCARPSPASSLPSN